MIGHNFVHSNGCSFHMPRPLPPVSPGWDLSGKAEGGKRTMRCTKLDRDGNRCLHEIRFPSNPPCHHCNLEAQHKSQEIQLLLEHWRSLPFQQRLQVVVAALVAITGAHLEIVENQLLSGILNSFVDLGRTEPRVHIGSLAKSEPEAISALKAIQSYSERDFYSRQEIFD
jgi:hypothetical protein